MVPIIRYKDTREEDRILYAEYFDANGIAHFEIPVPQTILGSSAIEKLKEALKSGEITGLVIKRAVCWEHYFCMDGYDTHEQITIDDFMSENFKKIIGSPPYRKDAKYERPATYGGSRKIRFSINFGPDLPKDYYGNYDYSMYPGGYGPSSAISQSD